MERRLAYEEGIRIPLLMRLPGAIAPRSEPAEFALTVDLAPTLMELGHATFPATLHGRSLVPVFKSQAADWRREFLIEHFSDKVFPRMANMGYQADFIATVADILGVKLPDNAGEDSFSLLPLLKGADKPIREHAVSCAVQGTPGVDQAIRHRIESHERRDALARTTHHGQRLRRHHARVLRRLAAHRWTDFVTPMS